MIDHESVIRILCTNNQLYSAAGVAQAVATIAHDGQTDMAGLEYITHCQRVVDNARNWYWKLFEREDYKMVNMPDEAQFEVFDLIQVCWLHDVVEDTKVTITDLYKMGFSMDVTGGVYAMTQQPGEDLETYWGRVKGNKLARACKLYGDIPDNDDPQRKEYLPPKVQEKLTAKYARARAFLGGN